MHTIAFTGSGAVGLEILRRRRGAAPASATSSASSPRWAARTACIVDADADLDDAVPAIVTVAFVYAGQKCSAASRVLVHEAIADALLERLAGAVEVLAGRARPTPSAPTCRR